MLKNWADEFHLKKYWLSQICIHQIHMVNTNLIIYVFFSLQLRKNMFAKFRLQKQNSKLQEIKSKQH